MQDGLEQDAVEYASSRVPCALIVEYFLHHGQSATWPLGLSFMLIGLGLEYYDDIRFGPGDYGVIGALLHGYLSGLIVQIHT